MRKLFLLGLLALLSLGACKEEKKATVVTTEIAFKKEGELQILKQKTDSVRSKLEIEIADNEYETQTGLMYRESLGKNHGMLFIFPDVGMHSFYMKNTQIPLDLMFIREDMTIATIAERAQPMDEASISSGVPVKYVLEVNAGHVEANGIQPGDMISYQRSNK